MNGKLLKGGLDLVGKGWGPAEVNGLKSVPARCWRVQGGEPLSNSHGKAILEDFECPKAGQRPSQMMQKCTRDAKPFKKKPTGNLSSSLI